MKMCVTFMMWKLVLCVLLQCVHSLRIVHMRVPANIQFGFKKSVTLDCDYVTNNVTGLVVKWFFNDKDQPVYQWIPPQKPQALGILKNKVDLSYRVSQNPYTKHRALHILSPTPNLSGNYTCVVSTFLDEDSRTKPMTIFVPEKSFTLIQDRLDEEHLNIICSVSGVFPKPELTVLLGNRPIKTKSSCNLINNRYTALSSAVVRVDSLPSTVEILCELLVPDASYLSRKRDIFYKDPPTTSPEPYPNTRTAPDSDPPTTSPEPYPNTRTAPDSGTIVFASPTLLLFLLIINYLFINHR